VSERGHRSIGEVLALLKEEFADVTISKIRFLESEGLITPERTASRYRKFSHEDVARLRYILRMQRDHYLPLKVIAEHLDAMDRGLEPPAIGNQDPVVPPRVLAADGAPVAGEFARREPLRISRQELLKRADISEAFFGELEAMGLIAAARQGYYGRDDLIVATTAKDLNEYGLEPRHLRGVKAAADREVGLIEQVASPYRRSSDPSAQARADEVASEIASLSVRLHATLVRSGIHR
jgi:DNA-binding transcriptional MerR regulator